MEWLNKQKYLFYNKKMYLCGRETSRGTDDTFFTKVEILTEDSGAKQRKSMVRLFFCSLKKAKSVHRSKKEHHERNYHLF